MEAKLEGAAAAREASIVISLQDQISALAARTLAYRGARERELATRLEHA